MDNMILTIKKDAQELQDTADLFYKGNEDAGFKAMEEGTQKLLTIVDALVEISGKDAANNNLDFNYINTALTEILNAYEKKDGILLADLLTYEILDYVQDVLEQWDSKGE